MFTLTIVPDLPSGEPGEAFEVTTTSRDIVRWEMGDRRRSVGTLTEQMRMSDITDLAWYAADRRGLTDLDIKRWRESVDIDFRKADESKDDDGSGDGVDTGEEAVGPTRKGR